MWSLWIESTLLKVIYLKYILTVSFYLRMSSAWSINFGFVISFCITFSPPSRFLHARAHPIVFGSITLIMLCKEYKWINHCHMLYRMAKCVFFLSNSWNKIRHRNTKEEKYHKHISLLTLLLQTALGYAMQTATKLAYISPPLCHPQLPFRFPSSSFPPSLLVNMAVSAAAFLTHYPDLVEF